MRGMGGRLLLPLVVLAGLLPLAALYAWGGDGYFELRRAAGLKAYAPFLDLQNVMAGIECWQRGVDVYAVNPCDVMGRLHIYSPLWLRLPPVFGRPDLLDGIGLTIGLGFAAVLLILPATAHRRSGMLMLLAVGSPVTFYALERANMDVPIFVCLAIAAVLLGGGIAARGLAYALILAVGLLKFYPLVLLILLLRERPALALAFGAIAAVAGLGLVLPLREEFVRALGNIPPLPAFSGTFGAGMLDKGVRALLPGVAALPVVATVLMAAGAVTLVWALAGDAATRRDLAAMPVRHRDLLLVGGGILVGCFVAGDSVEYRAIFLLLALPALLHLAHAGARRGLFAATAVAAAVLLWDPLVRRGVAWLFPSSDDLPSVPGLVLWGLRELAWWWVAAVLAALVVGLLRRAPGLALVGVRPAA